MRIFIDNIEVDNYAFIKEVYEDKIVLDKEITIPAFTRTCSVMSFPRVYGNISYISIVRASYNILYLDNEINPHHNRDSNKALNLYVTHGALIVPISVPEQVRKVLYNLFGKNKLRVAKKEYADWQKSVTFPGNREFELAWRIENRLGTHNPDYVENCELNLNTCDFCSTNPAIEPYHCEFYCGKRKERLRKKILETSM